MVEEPYHENNLGWHCPYSLGAVSRRPVKTRRISPKRKGKLCRRQVRPVLQVLHPFHQTIRHARPFLATAMALPTAVAAGVVAAAAGVATAEADLGVAERLRGREAAVHPARSASAAPAAGRLHPGAAVVVRATCKVGSPRRAAIGQTLLDLVQPGRDHSSVRDQGLRDHVRANQVVKPAAEVAAAVVVAVVADHFPVAGAAAVRRPDA